jgi:hypothetical protein
MTRAILEDRRRQNLFSGVWCSDTRRAHAILHGGEGHHLADEHSTVEEEAVTKQKAAFRQLVEPGAAGRSKHFLI